MSSSSSLKLSCSEYFEKHKLGPLLTKGIEEVVSIQPSNPLSFLISFLKKKEKEEEKASTSTLESFSFGSSSSKKEEEEDNNKSKEDDDEEEDEENNKKEDVETSSPELSASVQKEYSSMFSFKMKTEEPSSKKKSKPPAAIIANTVSDSLRKRYLLNNGRRHSVMCRVNYKELSTYKPPSYEKTKEIKDQLKQIFKGNVLFKDLDEKEKKILLKAFKVETKKKGTLLIKQGEEGDKFYVMLDGLCEIFVKKKDSKETTYGAKVATVKEGNSFGELALMYDQPRAASVLCITDVRIGFIDRLTFKSILISGTKSKRDRHLNFLNKVPLFTDLSKYQKMRIADSLEKEKFKLDQVIIKEGEEGEKFFIVEQGKVSVIKNGKNVATLEEGNYFGELALMFNQTRAATIIASTPHVYCVYLTRERFRELLGPCEHLLTKNSNQYQ